MADTVDTAIYKMSYDTGNSVAQLNQTRAAAEGLVATTEKVDRVTRTSSAGFDRMIGRYDGLARAQQTYERELSKLARYEAEGIGTAAQYATIRGKVEAAYNAETFAARAAAGQLTATERATKSLGVVTSDLQGRMQGAVGSIGLLGQTLSAVGPIGIGVAAGIGGATLAFLAMDSAAHALAQRAIGLRDFAASTGLTTAQVQGLEKAGAKLGISSESLQASLEKGSVAFEELRTGAGKTRDILQRYRPELLEQIASTEDYAEAITLLGSAFEGLTVSQQNVLGKSFFGKGSIETLRLIKGVDVAKKGTDFEASGRGLDPGQIQRLAELENQVIESSKKLKDSFSKLFAEDLLRGELAFYDGLNKIADWAKAFKLSPDFMTMVNALVNPNLGAGLGSYIGHLATGAIGQGGLESLFRPMDMGSDVAAGSKGSSGSGFSSIVPPVGYKEPSEEAAKVTPQFELKSLQEAAAALGAASTATEQYTIHIKELGIALEEKRISQEQFNRAMEQLGSSDAAARATQVQLSLAREATTEADRHSAAVLKIADSYKDVSVSTALVLAAQKDQLAIAESVTGAERLRATEVAKTNELLLAGKSAEGASKIAAGERANAQAQINTQVKQQVISLQEQLALANAVTGQDQMRVQYQITLNKLLRDGVDPILAQRDASLELAVAQASASKSVADQVRSLNQQTELMRAQANGNEAEVAASQAYSNAIRQGADATQAAALAAATLNNYLTKSAIEADRLEASMLNTAKAAGTVMINGQAQSATGSSMGMNTVQTSHGTITGSTSAGSLDWNKYGVDPYTIQKFGTSFQTAKTGMILQGQLDTKALLAKQAETAAAYDSKQGERDDAFREAIAKKIIDGISPLQIETEIMAGKFASMGASASAVLQQELELEKRAGVSPQTTLDEIKSGKIGQGVASSELLAAMDDLTKAVKSNTDAISLSPFYTQQGDHLLGYRGYSNDGVGIAAVPTATTTGQTPLPAPAPPPPTTSTQLNRPFNYIAIGWTVEEPWDHTATGTTSGSRYIYSSDPNQDTRARHFSSGGIAYSPTNASIAENEPEAVVPLAGGSIPVKIVGNAKNDNQAPIYITQNFFAPAERDDIRQTSYQAISEARRALGAR